MFKIFLTSALVALTASACTSDTKDDDDNSHAGTGQSAEVGPEGATVGMEDISVTIPPGALDATLSIKLDKLDSAATAVLPSPASSGLGSIELSSEAFALTPHGTTFALSVEVLISYMGDGMAVLRLDHEQDMSWEVVDNASLEDGTARFETDRFSIYAVGISPGSETVAVDDSDTWNDTGDAVWVDDSDTWSDSGDTGGQQNDPRSKGALATIAYSPNVSYAGGYLTLIYDGGYVFWTRDEDGKLSVFSANVSQNTVPVEPQLLFEADWAAASGWDDPPLLATTTHLVFPTVGMIDVGDGLMDVDGWTTLSRDGSQVELALLEDWWIASRGADVLLGGSFTSDGLLASPTTGDTTVLEDFIGRNFQDSCVYDASVDEVACLAYSSLRTYSFAETAPSEKIVTESSAFDEKVATPLKFNSTSWFVPVNLPSGSGIGAIARDGSGSVRYYEELEFGGSYSVDDAYLYVCLEGALTRISLSDEQRVVLTEDCAVISNRSIIGEDETYIYYFYASPDDMYFPNVIGTTERLIHRVHKEP